MPPKGVRRPAAVKAKAAPRGGPHRRGALGLRRPASAPAVRERERSLKEIGVGEWLSSGLVIFEGQYWDEKVIVAGKVEGFETRGEEGFLRVVAQGTQSETLLRYLGGVSEKRLWAHLCGTPCEALIWEDGVIHITQWKKAAEPLEPWMSNLLEVKPGAAEVDELARLRTEALRIEDKMPRKEDEKEKDKRSKSRKRRRSRKRRSSETRSRPRKMRVRPQKKVEELYKDTGMDPSLEVRKKFLKKAKRKTKRRGKKKNTSTESQSSSESSHKSGGEAASSSAQRLKLFSEDTVIQEVAENYPGTLTTSWVTSCQDHLLQSRGEVETLHDGALPALARKYVRMILFHRMSPPMQREALTLSTALDYLVKARPSEACDLLVQRLKSLEAMVGGVHFSVATRMELLGDERTMAASTQEALEAAKKASEMEKTFNRASKPMGRLWENPGGGKANLKGGKGDGKKGKNKDGKGKDGEKKGG